MTDKPQVWRYGPVFQWVYSAFSKFGNSEITDKVGMNPFGGRPLELDADAKPEVQALLGWIWSEYGHKSGIKLSDETHAVGTPWRDIAERHKFRVPLGTEIPSELDWKYFARLAERRGFAVVALRT